MSGECENSLTTMDWLAGVNVKISPIKNEFLESSLSLTSPTSSKDPYEDFCPVEREGGKPSYSYSTLIKFAISSTKSKRMSLRQIYKWISDNFPYYKDARNGWKNSIRHNLSLNKCFVKVPRERGDMGKGSNWSLREGIPKERLGATATGMRVPAITVTEFDDIFQHHRATGNICSSTSAAVSTGSVSNDYSGVGSRLNSSLDLTDSSVGALAALIGSQGDQLLGAAFAPSVSHGAQEPMPLPASHQNHEQQQLQRTFQSATSPVTPPPPPLSPPSASVADQLSLSASLQTICRSLLAESSSGSSGSGAFARVSCAGDGGASIGKASGLGAGGSVGCSHPPDLSASTLDFVQRMLPQLRDSFQLSDSNWQDLWDHCRSTSRPAPAAVTSASSAAAELALNQDLSSGVIPLPTADLPRPLPPPAIHPSRPSVTQTPRTRLSQPSHQQQAVDIGLDVEDDFNWDSIL